MKMEKKSRKFPCRINFLVISELSLSLDVSTKIIRVHAEKIITAVSDYPSYYAVDCITSSGWRGEGGGLP